MSKSNSNELRWRFTGFLIALFVSVPIEFTLSKIDKYEQDGYESYKSEYAIDLYSSFLKAKAKCDKEKTAIDKNSCHEAVDVVTKRHIEPRDLLAQETMALATRGLLWAGAWQAVFSFGALTLLGLTVYQTGRMVKHSQSASDYAQQTLNVARDEFRCHLAIDKDVHAKRLGQSVDNPVIPMVIKVRNEGKTAAERCTYCWGYWLHDSDDMHYVTTVDHGSGTVGDGRVRSGQGVTEVVIDIDVRLWEVEHLMFRLQGVDKYTLPFCIDYTIRFIAFPKDDVWSITGSAEIIYDFSPYRIDTPDAVVRQIEKSNRA